MAPLRVTITLDMANAKELVLIKRPRIRNWILGPPGETMPEPRREPSSGQPGQLPQSPQPAHRRVSRIGPRGTFSRIVLGLGLVNLAAFERWTPGDWGLAWSEAILGILVFPTAVVVVALAARRFLNGPIRMMGPLGLALNTAGIILLMEGTYTHDAALLFYGVSFPIAAWRDLPGCEVTVVSNLILKRDYQIGYPVLAPVDELEERMKERRALGGASEESMDRARPTMAPAFAQTHSVDPSRDQRLGMGGGGPTVHVESVSESG